MTFSNVVQANVMHSFSHAIIFDKSCYVHSRCTFASSALNTLKTISDLEVVVIKLEQF